MEKSNMVQESTSGTTHVINPSNPDSFSKQAKPGSLYVEFSVPGSSLKVTNENLGWYKIIGPNSLEGRYAAYKGLPIPEMPPALDIAHMFTKGIDY